jgi:hypothetical protein
VWIDGGGRLAKHRVLSIDYSATGGNGMPGDGADAGADGDAASGLAQIGTGVGGGSFSAAGLVLDGETVAG